MPQRSTERSRGQQFLITDRSTAIGLRRVEQLDDVSVREMHESPPMSRRIEIDPAERQILTRDAPSTVVDQDAYGRRIIIDRRTIRRCHAIMTPASRQIAVASFSAPRTTPFEMPGATATSSITDDGWANRVKGAEIGI